MSWTTTNLVGGVVSKAWADETRAYIPNVPAATSTTNAMTGRIITIETQGSTAYHVSLTFLTAAPGNIGEVGITIDSATQFTVYNTGNAGIAFSYKVMK